jgi:hypothetical protein
LFSRLLVEDQAEEFGAKLDNSGYVFSLAPDHGTFLDPSTTTHHAVAVGTANRAVALLADEGLIQASRDRRPVVLEQGSGARNV